MFLTGSEWLLLAISYEYMVPGTSSRLLVCGYYLMPWYHMHVYLFVMYRIYPKYRRYSWYWLYLPLINMLRNRHAVDLIHRTLYSL